MNGAGDACEQAGVDLHLLGNHGGGSRGDGRNGSDGQKEGHPRHIRLLYLRYLQILLRVREAEPEHSTTVDVAGLPKQTSRIYCAAVIAASQPEARQTHG